MVHCLFHAYGFYVSAKQIRAPESPLPSVLPSGQDFAFRQAADVLRGELEQVGYFIDIHERFKVLRVWHRVPPIFSVIGRDDLSVLRSCQHKV